MRDTLHLAFYRGAGRWDDQVIRAATRSAFSHVELVRNYGRSDCQAISASGRDGGVRIKKIDFEPVHWHIVHLLRWPPEDTWQRAVAHVGASYDYRGILMSHALPLRRHDPSRWFCSELCAHALGIRQPHRLAPEDLHNVILDMNAAFMRGKSAA